MRYNRCRKDELVKFATDREVVVNSKTEKGPTKKDYIAALVKADQDATFPFENLAPELRNMVYAELLTLQDSFTCFPQILRTSRQINQEATGLLYRLNYVDVVIKDSGVCAHGHRCGSFTPHMLRLQPDTHFTALKWPEFLRRAHHLRVIVPDDIWSQLSVGGADQRIGCIANTLYSLCRMLREGNSVRHLRIMAQPDAASAMESIQAMFYPLRMLGGMTLEIVDGSGTSLANFYTDQDAGIAITSPEAHIRLLYDCYLTMRALSDGLADRKFPGFYPLERAATAFLNAVSAAGPWSESDRDKTPAWFHALHTAVVQVRTTMEARHQPRTPVQHELFSRVYRLLALEVDKPGYGRNPLVAPAPWQIKSSSSGERS
ncbi:uncharacterized protein RHO25_006163 [Cercospora beticola]|uniref:Uncharacterized protein n=1 Tax=Cercospora beticola TaxID=122368 RepID=A0ABZ0NQ00_CERBT|nr:hypothetical protein RHO25_006163 [Cercospora beticola]CAK1363672.1 unnamed protein product [Cercospora beticola]